MADELPETLEVPDAPKLELDGARSITGSKAVGSIVDAIQDRPQDQQEEIVAPAIEEAQQEEEVVETEQPDAQPQEKLYAPPVEDVIAPPVQQTKTQQPQQQLQLSERAVAAQLYEYYEQGHQLQPEHAALVSKYYPETAPPETMSDADFTSQYASLLGEGKTQEAAQLNARYVTQKTKAIEHSNERSRRQQLAAQAKAAQAQREAHELEASRAREAEIQRYEPEIKKMTTTVQRAYAGIPESKALRAIEIAKKLWVETGDVKTAIAGADAVIGISRTSSAPPPKAVSSAVVGKGRIPGHTTPSNTREKNDGFVPNLSHFTGLR